MHPPDSYDGLGDRLPPLGRPGQVSDVVDGVLFLESLPYITGEILHIDGGQIAGHRQRSEPSREGSRLTAVFWVIPLSSWWCRSRSLSTTAALVWPSTFRRRRLPSPVYPRRYLTASQPRAVPVAFGVPAGATVFESCGAGTIALELAQTLGEHSWGDGRQLARAVR